MGWGITPHPGICSEWLLRLRQGARGVLELLSSAAVSHFSAPTPSCRSTLVVVRSLEFSGASLALWSCSRLNAPAIPHHAAGLAQRVYPPPRGGLHQAVWRHTCVRRTARAPLSAPFCF